MTRTRKKITMHDVWAFLSTSLQSLSRNIAAIIVILGALTGIFNWLVGKGTEILDLRLNDVKAMISEVDAKSTASAEEQELSLIRLELIMLMEHDPDNKAEIEKLARHYFIDLGGDQYMSSLYSQWAEKHGATTYFH